MKENFEDLLRKLKEEPGSESDLGEKIKNVFRRLKSEMEKRVILSLKIDKEILKFMKEEGIYDGDDTSLSNPIRSFFYSEFRPIIKNGMYSGAYLFFENTPVPEEVKKDIKLREEFEAKVEAYVKEHDGNPDPKEFRDLVYSLYPGSPNKTESQNKLLASSRYDKLTKKYNIEVFYDKNQIQEDIRSALENLNLDYI